MSILQSKFQFINDILKHHRAVTGQQETLQDHRDHTLQKLTIFLVTTSQMLISKTMIEQYCRKKIPCLKIFEQQKLLDFVNVMECAYH